MHTFCFLLLLLFFFVCVCMCSLPTRASEQGNVIGLVSVYIRSCHQKKFVIERTRDLI